MAPWPAQGNEPKAPDRNKTSDNRTLETLKSKSEPPEDKKQVKGISKEDQSESVKKDVHSLDDGQLKALLDEAIQYKNPKDREGKSKIFRELLQKVEADDSDCSYPVVGVRGICGRRALRVREGNRGAAISERASRGGSLQNIFHAASSAEFDTHHSGGARKKNKRQGPGSSVSARQREGGSLPSNVNAGWPLESWQSDQSKKKGLFDRDSLQPNHVSTSIGNTAYTNSSSVAISSTQTRRQTLKHSASNELPSSKKTNSGELYPLRRHHSSSDQLKSLELNVVKLKSQSESSSSMVRKMPQLPKPAECVTIDMSGLNLEIKKLGNSDPSLSFEKKLQTFQNSDKYRVTSGEGESENASNNSQEVFTTRASLEVEPVDSSIELGFGEKRVLNGMESVQLSDNYPSVQCIVGDRSRISDASNQARGSEQTFGLRPHMYRNINMNMNMIVNISSKTANHSLRTDENGNALSGSGLTSRGNISKNQKKKLPKAEKNVFLSQNIGGYRGDEDINIVLKFIESDKAKNRQIKKLTKGKKHEKKRQNMQKSTSLEEVSQRNIDDLTESSESERTSVGKPRTDTAAEESLRDRRRWGEQGFVKSGSQNDLHMEQEEENNSDSDFQVVTKKQRKKKVTDPNPKRARNHRNSRRSPRRKSTSSVPPSERSGDSDLDSVHSLPVGDCAPTASYADIAAGNSNFTSKAISEMSTFNGKNPEKVDSVSAVKTNEIEKWCDSVSQHWDKTKCNNNNNININNKNNSNSGNSPNNKNSSNITNNNENSNNTINNNYTTINSHSDSKNCFRSDNRKQNFNVDVNEICDNNVKKLKDLVTVDKSVGNKVATTNKVVDVPMRNDIKQIASSCDLDQCKLVDGSSKGTEGKKNWNKKNFSPEDFPSLPVKSENGNHNQKKKEISEQNSFAKTKQYSSLPDSGKHGEEVNSSKTPKVQADEEGRHRRSTRSKSVGPNTRPPVILLHDEKTKDTGVCEITFGFEINEQLLTSDDQTPVLEEETELGLDDTSSSSSKGSCQSNGGQSSGATQGSSETPVQLSSVNGGIVYSDVLEGQNAYVNSSSKGMLGTVTNTTLQELFKRHENMASVSNSGNNSTATSVNSIANKYVPPVAPVQFNYDKIVTFVGLAWEDVMKNGKIQYYTGNN
ncbi:hypothetical protein RUM44_012231 [Polyplax serrata]|uniref:Uncharacterized protein n=1 Tax=Polyplax serrata TaxID=468196 RepID=A0ABR1BF45_POLSC